MLKINNFYKKISRAENILLITHVNPDGDALGATLALYNFLSFNNKNVSAVCADEIPNLFKFLPNIEKFKKDFLIGDYDLVIILDCGDLKRTGFLDRLKKNINKNKIINIDHHPKNDVHKIACLNLVDYNASSTAEIIYKIIKKRFSKIERSTATCLLCGLFNDTGGFRHSNTSSEVLDISSELLSSGANLKKISSNISYIKSVSALKIWGLILSRVQRIEELDLVTSVITKEDLKKYNASSSDLAGAVNLINTIPKCSAAILFSETEDGKIKASLRTERDDVDVSKLAHFFGGGGFKKASGFCINGRIKKDENGGWKVIKN